jgi:hypothetical protein
MKTLLMFFFASLGFSIVLADSCSPTNSAAAEACEAEGYVWVALATY